jgi:hypothetical protein
MVCLQFQNLLEVETNMTWEKFNPLMKSSRHSQHVATRAFLKNDLYWEISLFSIFYQYLINVAIKSISLDFSKLVFLMLYLFKTHQTANVYSWGPIWYQFTNVVKDSGSKILYLPDLPVEKHWYKKAHTLFVPYSVETRVHPK